MDKPEPDPRRAAPWVVFDGDCGFCTTSAGWLARRLQRGREPDVRLTPWQRTDLAALGTTRERAQREVLWVDPDGRVEGGAAAVAAWLRHAGGAPAVVGAVMTWPGLRRLAAAAYRLVAANRHRLPGGTPACALPPGAPPGAQAL